MMFYAQSVCTVTSMWRRRREGVEGGGEEGKEGGGEEEEEDEERKKKKRGRVRERMHVNGMEGKRQDWLKGQGGMGVLSPTETE